MKWKEGGRKNKDLMWKRRGEIETREMGKGEMKWKVERRYNYIILSNYFYLILFICLYTVYDFK